MKGKDNSENIAGGFEDDRRDRDQDRDRRRDRGGRDRQRDRQGFEEEEDERPRGGRPRGSRQFNEFDEFSDDDLGTADIKRATKPKIMLIVTTPEFMRPFANLWYYTILFTKYSNVKCMLYLGMTET